MTMNTRLATGSLTDRASRPSKSSPAAAARSSSPPPPALRNGKGLPVSNHFFSTRALVLRRRASNTIRLPSSANCAAMWMSGADCLISMNGKSARKPHGCCNTGGIIPSTTSGHLLPDWGRRNRHLVDGSCAKVRQGGGKTTVMAMLIAWQTVNAVRRPTSKNFTRGFLIVAPGLTIRDRLRVL